MGGGPSSTCCGANTTIGSIISNNTIRDPTGLAVANGQHTYGAATSGNTYWNNNIFCGSVASKATGVGFALFDGDIDYNGTNNGPEACNIGFEVVPGTVSDKAQNVGGQFRGALGDQSAIHDLLIQPSTALGTIDFFDAVNAWAATTGNRRTVLVDCATGSCQEISFVGSNFHGGTGQAVPVMDIEGGSGGPYDLSIVGSNICQFGTPGANGIALKIDETSAGNGRIVVSGNRLGTGCPGRALHTGIWLAVSGGSGLVTITGNDISAVNTPISYAPTGTDHVIVANNMGLDDIFTAVADAATIDPGLSPGSLFRNRQDGYIHKPWVCQSPVANSYERRCCFVRDRRQHLQCGHEQWRARNRFGRLQFDSKLLVDEMRWLDPAGGPSMIRDERQTCRFHEQCRSGIAVRPHGRALAQVP